METVKIRGREFSFVSKYRPGHVCTEAEARALNLSLKKHVKDAMGKRVGMDFASQAGRDRIQLIIDTFVEEFDFGQDAGVRLECLRIAKEIVKKSIRANGGNSTDYLESSITEAAKELFEDPKAAEGIRQSAMRNLAHAPSR